MTSLLFILPTWNPQPWLAAMGDVAPHLNVMLWAKDKAPSTPVDYAAAWLPPSGALQALPHLKAIFSLGAGVDALLRDKTLPRHVPLVRVNDRDLTARMGEYIVLHVLMHLRQQRRIEANQQARLWDHFSTPSASQLTIGLMGLGVMGREAAARLKDLGFRLRGWSRTLKDIPGVSTFAGPEQFDDFLAGTDVLISLLPATAETQGIINRRTLRKLSRRGPFAAPYLINAGRGSQQVAADIIAAIDAGELFGATLDVFAVEPLPPDDPFWRHPKVIVTPHGAADSNPKAICHYIAGQIARAEAGHSLENLVDYTTGY